MANMLRDLFSDAKPQEQLTISFKTKEDRQKFEQDLLRLSDDFDFYNFEVTGTKSVQRKESIDGKVYPCDEGNIVKTYVGVYREKYPFEFEINRKKYHVDFICIKKKTGIILETAQEKPIRIKILMQEKQDTHISFGVIPDKATNVNEIISGVELQIAFCTFVEMSDKEKKQELLKSLNDVLAYWKIVDSVGKYFSVSFNPSKRDGTDFENVYFLYFMFVNGYAIKKFRKPFSHTLDGLNENALKTIEVGSLMAVYWQTDITYIIYGQEIAVSYIEFVPKAKVKSINRQGEDTVQIDYSVADNSDDYIETYLLKTSILNIDEVTTPNAFGRYIKGAKTVDELLRDSRHGKE